MPAEVWDCTASAYHAAHGWFGNSQLEVLRESPGRFRGRFITHTIPEPTRSRDQQDRLLIGDAFHVLLLLPALFDERAFVCDEPAFLKAKESRSSGVWKAWKKDVDARMREECPSCDGQGEIIDPERPLVVAKCAACRGAGFVATRDRYFLLRPSDRQRLDDMADAAWAHPELADILERTKQGRERALRWRCEVTDIPLKCRFDGVDDEDTLELKSCEESSPDAAARIANDKGYHRQQAQYDMGFKAWRGRHPRRRYLAFVSKQPPHDVGVFALDEDSAELGHEQRLEDLHNLRRRLDEDDWTAPHSHGVQPLRLPRWAFPPDQPITLGGKQIL